MVLPQTKNVLFMQVDVETLSTVVERISNLAASRKGAYVCVSNVHMCMEAFDSLEFRKVVNGADIVLADGRPIAVAQRLLGASGAAQVRGQDVMESLCETSVRSKLRIGLYGGSSQSLLGEIKQYMEKRYPGIDISYCYSPPFRSLSPEENSHVVQSIHDAQVDILFVALGCPKQERWMAAQRDSLDCVMLGVGAAFDFISGNKKHAPRWMQYIGMEWVFRLATEPRRLAGRYFKHNPRFIYYLLLQLVLKKQF